MRNIKRIVVLTIIVGGLLTLVVLLKWAPMSNRIRSADSVNSSPEEKRETTAPKKELGESPDNPIPIGTPVKFDLPYYVGDQEITVLGSFMEVRQDFSILGVKVKIKALENTDYMGRLDYKLIDRASGKIYEGSFGGTQDLIAGSSMIDLLTFNVKSGESDFVLVWEPHYGDAKPRFLGIGAITQVSSLSGVEGWAREIRFEK